MNATDAKQTMEYLRLQSVALASSSISFVVTDRDGRIIYANEAFAEMTGYTVAESIGQTLHFLKSGHQDDGFYKQMWTTILAGRVWRGELLNKHKDGTFYYEEMTITPVRDEQGQVAKFVAIKQDVTDKKQFQQQLIQTQKMESIGRLAGGIAHDFNNILQVILGFSNILLDTMKDDNPYRTDVNEIHVAATRAAALTQQLLAFSRKQITAVAPINLNNVVHKMENMLRQMIGENINLGTVLEPNLKMVNADAAQIEAIIMNLAANGRDAMPAGGRLTISTDNIIIAKQDAIMMPEATPGDFVCLAVSDNGIGMDQETIRHLFEPFYTTKGAGKGTGLGLATAYAIARQHNGWINVYSQRGYGSTFKLYLQAFTDIHSAGQKTETTFIIKSSKGHGQRILLVEDDQAVQRMAVMLLRANGYRVMVASTAQEAIDIFARENGSFDLLFSDVMLPDNNGLWLAEQLLFQKPGLRVIMTSGYSDQQSRWPNIHEKGWLFLQKPYAVATFLQFVARAIQPDPQG